MLKTCQNLRRFTLVATVATVSLSGCVGLDPATVSSQPVMPICYAMAVARAGNAPASGAQTGIDELRRRGTFSGNDLAHIAAGRIVPGMTEAAAICVKGFGYERVNTTVTSGGTSRQLVFGSGDIVPTSYVYTRNGIVTAAQY